jgi:hypothetical protein
MRWTHLRGKRKVQYQAMLVFAAMNLKKLRHRQVANTSLSLCFYPKLGF